MTIDEDLVAPGDVDRVAHVVALVRRFTGRAPDGDLVRVRALDLGCRTGAFALDLSQLGATVHGIEGRDANLDRAPRRPGITYRLGDVRTLDPLVDGFFDIGLCLGILYHMDASSAYDLLVRLRTCIPPPHGHVILDTHVADPALALHEAAIKGADGLVRWYVGRPFGEVPSLWSGLEPGRDSWWFTRESLAGVCTLAGWTHTQIEAPNYPPEAYTAAVHPATAPNRIWWVLS
jgi:SAM-dependent methyltransferase